MALKKPTTDMKIAKQILVSQLRQSVRKYAYLANEFKRFQNQPCKCDEVNESVCVRCYRLNNVARAMHQMLEIEY